MLVRAFTKEKFVTNHSFAGSKNRLPGDAWSGLASGRDLSFSAHSLSDHYIGNLVMDLSARADKQMPRKPMQQ